MKNFDSKNFQIIIGTSLFFLGFLFDGNLEVKATTCQENPNTFPSSCMKTPVIYKTRIYELGLCTDDPLSGTTGSGNNITSDYEIDLSTCAKTFEAENGTLVDLSTIGAPQALIGKDTRPPVGNYPYAYVKLSNTFVLKGSQLINDVPFYSSSDGTATKVLSEYTEWDNKVIDFEKGVECEPLANNRKMASVDTYTSGDVVGTVKAVLSHITSGNFVATTPEQCGTSNRVFGSFKPTNPVIITTATKGLEVSFSIKNKGLAVVPWSGIDDSEVGYFSTGPFLPSFTTFE